MNNESNTINTTEINPITDRTLSMALSIPFNTIFIAYVSEPYFFICSIKFAAWQDVDGKNMTCQADKSIEHCPIFLKFSLPEFHILYLRTF